jgi:hypothetical protein
MAPSPTLQAVVQMQLDNLMDQMVIPGHHLFFVSWSPSERDRCWDYMSSTHFPDQVDRNRNGMRFGQVWVFFLYFGNALSRLRGSKGKAFISNHFVEEAKRTNFNQRTAQDYENLVLACRIMNDKEKQEQENYGED